MQDQTVIPNVGMTLRLDGAQLYFVAATSTSGESPDRVFWIVKNMKKDESEAEKKEIQDAKLKAKQAGITLRKVRKKLYIFSAFSLVYIVYGLHIRFQLFENGTTGIGFQNGFAIEGLNDLVIETVLLVTVVIILFRFMWYAAVFAYAHFAHYRLNRLFARKEVERWETYKYYNPNLAKEEDYHNYSSDAVVETRRSSKYTKRNKAFKVSPIYAWCI